MKKVEEASRVMAEAVKLCKPVVIPMYPITPQTHIVERLAEFISNGELNSEMIHTESEHSAISAAVGASATGVRTFTATSSQGLALMHEILFIASGLRLPIVMGVANRALSSLINIWNDHQDSMSARDSGWIQLYCESSQEVFDTTIQAFKIAEKTFLPVMVCLDGFSLSHVYEPVDFLNQKEVDSFLPEFKPKYKLDPKKPITVGPVGFPDIYMELRQKQNNAILDSIKIIKEINNNFKKRFKRAYGDGLIEEYNIKDAKKVFVALGSVCGTIKHFIDNTKGVGLLKIKCFRPFPKNELLKKLRNKEVIVIDKAFSAGHEGIVANELRALGLNVKGFVAGLGGRDIKIEHLKKTLKSKAEWLL